MGKWEEDPPPPTVTHSQSPDRPVDSCSCCARIARLFRFRCVFVLVLGLSVLLSAVFWLPPFFRHGDQGDLDLDSHYKGKLCSHWSLDADPHLISSKLSGHMPNEFPDDVASLGFRSVT
ncbi:hypothetical protein L1987_41281 [Smallanthus sonchifolius]|uniref:Uncharacterized protein n=1 Tax=Smallanthus sonchifolius TaxID=185202 RepID=A0ACB9GUM8_9ASTR|nr:hypothetical protein L1987_41281 [Smallanthus sonchifolius]